MSYEILTGNHDVPDEAHRVRQLVRVETLLEGLNDEGVFKIQKIDNDPRDLFLIEECIDNYYSVRLTRQQLRELADEIRALAENE